VIVEVIAVGTELLLGQIVNSNAADIGRRLAELGHSHYRQTVVGDNLERCAAAIAEAIERADAVIITGGLGPTQDDLTREAICAATGRAMVYSESYATHLADWWAARGREMPESNLRQAEFPEGAEMIPNAKGTAPGLRLLHGGATLFALPGVPAELQPMLDDFVIPELGGSGTVHSRLLRTWGESESKVADLLGDIYDDSANPTLAFLASGGEIKLRLTAAAESAAAARDLIAPVEEEIRRRLGSLVFGADSETVEQLLFDMLAERGWTIGTAESATGGRIAAALTAVPGASAVFRGSVVAYAADIKSSLLAVPAELIAEEAIVSVDTAIAMAEGAASALGVDVAIAVTGSAGPEPLGQPRGTMAIAVRTPHGTSSRTMRMPGDRERVLTYTTTAALHLARLAIAGDAAL
jgi:nicotinamide-nucleotide amidase